MGVSALRCPRVWSLDGAHETRMLSETVTLVFTTEETVGGAARGFPVDCALRHQPLCRLQETVKGVSRSEAVNRALYLGVGHFMFALCTFVETFITHIYENRSIYFCKPQVLLCWVTPQGSASGEGPRLSVSFCTADPRSLGAVLFRRPMSMLPAWAARGVGFDFKPLYRIFL